MYDHTKKTFKSLTGHTSLWLTDFPYYGHRKKNKKLMALPWAVFLFGSLWCIVWFACQVNRGLNLISNFCIIYAKLKNDGPQIYISYCQKYVSEHWRWEAQKLTPPKWIMNVRVGLQLLQLKDSRTTNEAEGSCANFHSWIHATGISIVE